MGLEIGTLFPPRTNLIIRYKALTIKLFERQQQPDSDLAPKRDFCASSRLTAFPANFQNLALNSYRRNTKSTIPC